MNNIQISGRLGHDVSLRYMTNETAGGRFSVAVDRGKKNGEDQGTDWFECVAFGKQAETINRLFHKGDWIEVVGFVRIDKYTDRDGITRKSFDINVGSFGFGPGNQRNQEQPQQNPQPPEADPVPGFKTPDEDIPF